MGLFLNILLTIIIISGLAFGINFVILYPNIPNSIYLFIISVFIVSFLMGSYISYNTGRSQCQHSKWKTCLWRGFYQASFTTLVYVIVFFVPFFKSGFIALTEDTFRSNWITEAILMSLTSISLTIDNYFKSIRDNCVLDLKASSVSWNRIEKRLNSRESPEDADKVEIKA